MGDNLDGEGNEASLSDCRLDSTPKPRHFLFSCCPGLNTSRRNLYFSVQTSVAQRNLSMWPFENYVRFNLMGVVSFLQTSRVL
jgi:hypothetical protein